MQDAESPMLPPQPELEPRPITLEQYLALTPEKLELIEGYLIDAPDYTKERRDLLLLLLVNEGLLQTVRLVPPERWRGALSQVYGEP